MPHYISFHLQTFDEQEKCVTRRKYTIPHLLPPSTFLDVYVLGILFAEYIKL